MNNQLPKNNINIKCNSKPNYENLLKGYYLTDGQLLKLINSYKLTDYEKAVCFFICKQVALKDIASILDHTYESIKKARQRIFKKLKLVYKNTDIDKYILHKL